MSRYVVTEILEGARFRIAYDRLVRGGPPYMEAILQARIGQLREEFTRLGPLLPGSVPHTELDGSYVVEREGMRVRYFVTPTPRAGWLKRVFGRAITPRAGMPVRVWLQGLDWPAAERLFAR